jgi:hypothetical protein
MIPLNPANLSVDIAEDMRSLAPVNHVAAPVIAGCGAANQMGATYTLPPLLICERGLARA